MEYVFGNQYGVLTVRKKDSIGKPQTIRFIDFSYKTLFEIPDNSYILVKYQDGTKKAYQCSYIDDYHCLIGTRAFHICEFSEMMERIGAHYSPCPEKYIVWSDINLDFKDWEDDLKAEYPNADELLLYSKMIETNGFYLDDERMNLKTPVGGPLLVIADLGLWNGRRHGYCEIPNASLSDCLDYRWDMAEWRVTMDGEFLSEQIHHDGTNYYVYRKYKESASEDQIDELKEKLYEGTAKPEDIDRVTEKLGPLVASVYGWELPDQIYKKKEGEHHDHELYPH